MESALRPARKLQSPPEQMQIQAATGGAAPSKHLSHKESLRHVLLTSRSEWSAKQVRVVEQKLVVVGVNCVAALDEALREREDRGQLEHQHSLNQRLRAVGQKAFGEETLSALRARLAEPDVVAYLKRPSLGLAAPEAGAGRAAARKPARPPAEPPAHLGRATASPLRSREELAAPEAPPGGRGEEAEQAALHEPAAPAAPAAAAAPAAPGASTESVASTAPVASAAPAAPAVPAASTAPVASAAPAGPAAPAAPAVPAAPAAPAAAALPPTPVEVAREPPRGGGDEAAPTAPQKSALPMPGLSEDAQSSGDDDDTTLARSDDAASGSAQSADDTFEAEGEWTVVHSRVYIRAAPSTSAETLGFAMQGCIVRGTPQHVGMTTWLRVSPEDAQALVDYKIVLERPAWILTDAESLGLGLGQLLQPGADKSASAASAKMATLNSIRAARVWDQGRVEDYTFSTDDVDWPEYLRLHGFCVLKDVLPAADFGQLEKTFWREMEHVVPGLKREDPATWRFPRDSRGIAREWGLPHSEFAWSVRVHPRMKHIFALIYGTEELVVGMDSVKLDDCEVHSQGAPWLHRDQLMDVEAYSIQSIYTFYEVGPENAGTILIEDSHLEEYPWDRKQDGVSLLRSHGRQRNSVKLPKGLQQEFMARAFKPHVPDNGLILFNSRVIHANAPSSVVRWRHEAEHRKPRPSLPRPNRVGVSVAMCPRSRRSEHCRSRKMRVYMNQGSTAHWPDDELHWPDEWTGAEGDDMNEVWDRWGSQSKESAQDKWSERPGSRFRHLPKPDVRRRERVNML